MARDGHPKLSAAALRAELSARNLQRGEDLQHESTFGRIPSVVYAQDEEGGHGNFLRPSFRRIQADPAWAARLQKTYTGSARLPRATDRWRGELECAGSSDALLMNVFCYPGILRRPSVCAALGIPKSLRPDFGVRAALPMERGEVDRTEVDMVLGDLFVEAKLTEGGFGRASEERVLRYTGVSDIFYFDELPRSAGGVTGYQILRGMLTALHADGRYLVLLDARRTDLVEICFRVLRAVRDAGTRSRFRLLSWQELAGALPVPVQEFLATKYGIDAV